MINTANTVTLFFENLLCENKELVLAYEVKLEKQFRSGYLEPDFLQYGAIIIDSRSVEFDELHIRE